MKQNRNLYKRDITRGYEGQTDIALRNEMKNKGYKTGVWVTPNQMEGVNYALGQLSLIDNAKPIIVQKYDYRTDTMHSIKLYNVDQTNLPIKHPGTYQHLVDEYAELYNEINSRFTLRSLIALF